MIFLYLGIAADSPVGIGVGPEPHLHVGTSGNLVVAVVVPPPVVAAACEATFVTGLYWPRSWTGPHPAPVRAWQAHADALSAAGAGSAVAPAVGAFPSALGVGTTR